MVGSAHQGLRIGIDVRHGLIRTWKVTSAATYEGAELRQGLLDTENTAQGVWADTAYRSVANEAFMAGHGFVSHVHRKKPKGRPMENDFLSGAFGKAGLLSAKR